MVLESSNSQDVRQVQRPSFLLLYFLLVAVVGLSFFSFPKEIGAIQSAHIEHARFLELSVETKSDGQSNVFELSDETKTSDEQDGVLKLSIQKTQDEQANVAELSVEKISDDPPDLLLSVPFYVYEDLSWLNATFVGRPVSEVAYSSKKNATSFKHGDDYWFIVSSLRHPMRTHNISEAKIFFVPLLLNFLDEEMYYKGPLCSNGRCDWDLLMHTQEQLRKSPAFQKYPDRHFVV
eukprot:scaffold10490_cov129-Cylindrotheca_fusiformis.AAC.12